MTKLLDMPETLGKGRLTFEFLDDFLFNVNADFWTVGTTNDGTALVGDAVAGKISLLTAATTIGNEITFLASTEELWLFAEAKPVLLEARFQFTEANTDDANVFFGLSSVADATILGDDGAGPPGTYDGVGFHKVDGGTVWVVENSFASTQETTTLTAGNSLDGVEQTAGGAAFQTLQIYVQPTTATLMDVSYFIDTILVEKHTDVTMTTPEEMHLIFAMKDGSSANEETLVADYIYAGQTR